MVFADVEDLSSSAHVALPMQPSLPLVPLTAAGKKKEKVPVKEDTVNKWLSIFSWLFILNLGKRQDGEHPRGVCNLCKAAVKDRVIKPVKGWTDPSGATLFDGNACLTHAMSNGHQRAVDHASNRQDQQRSWNSMASAAAKRVSELGIICVITAAWMLGNNIPIHKFAQLLLLYKAHGFVALDRKYNHSRYVWAAMRALSEAIMASMLAVVVSSPVFALLFDLSSDVGNEEHMLVYIRCVNTVTLMPVTMFLCCVRVMGKRGLKWPRLCRPSASIWALITSTSWLLFARMVTAPTWAGSRGASPY